MFLLKLILKNFRKFEYLEVPFKNGLNVLIGENDSGKTAIIDAIRIVLGTQSNEYYYLDERDFYNKDKELIIECIFKFKEPSDFKAGNFVEWITFDEDKNPLLKVRLKAKIKNFKVRRYITAGDEDLDSNFDLYDELRVTYLKPLRDADNELVAKRNSRLAQILKNHDLFFEKEENHEFINSVRRFNEEIDYYFSTEEKGKKIIDNINSHLNDFLGEEKNDEYKTRINITESNLGSILNNLNLKLSKYKIGLGTLNQLYMALELLLFDSSNILNLCLIEELEAHIHPQAQLRTIKHFQNKIENKSQIILTTHSTILASSIKLENLILCKNNNVYPMGYEYTELEKEDYKFLEIFLDATKANLFFAKGVIFVEGDAENMIVPTIAEIIEKPLHKYGISLVNIKGTAFSRYLKIFLRKNGNEKLNIPVALITDLDVKDKDIKVIKLTETDIRNLNEIFKVSKKLEKLEGKIFLNKENLKRTLREMLQIKRFKRNEVRYISELEAISISIDEYRTEIKRRKQENYNQGEIKTFINKKRTLEYDLAMSCLQFELNNAILVTQEKDILSQEKFDQEFRNLTDEEKAKRIFIENFYSDDSLNKKANLSKATVALNLAYFLQERQKQDLELKNKILEDEYLEYIVKAIKYVTGDKNV